MVSDVGITWGWLMTFDSAAPREEISMLPFVTAAVWLFCLTVGLLGLGLRYPRPVAPKPEVPPVQAQFVNVQITQSARSETPPSRAATAPPPEAPTISAPPAAPALVPVAMASPAILFARPVQGPTTTVAARYAAPASSGPPVQRLVFGSGLGQHAPEYPREAALAHEEGVVSVRFSVDDTGLVISASAAEPCPFSLLNQSAVRTIRDEWRFPPGPPRLYEVSITFQLR
jgi:protein TonB